MSRMTFDSELRDSIEANNWRMGKRLAMGYASMAERYKRGHIGDSDYARAAWSDMHCGSDCPETSGETHLHVGCPGCTAMRGPCELFAMAYGKGQGGRILRRLAHLIYLTYETTLFGNKIADESKMESIQAFLHAIGKTPQQITALSRDERQLAIDDRILFISRFVGDSIAEVFEDYVKQTEPIPVSAKYRFTEEVTA